jgi:hypothetical protein
LGNIIAGQSTGVNWYDRFNLLGDPGEQTEENDVSNVGWSNNVASDNIDTISYQTTRHALDEIPKSFWNNVRFRFALGISTKEPQKAGFAFDDFEILERKKEVLLEIFSSELDTNSKKVNDLIFGDGADTNPTTGLVEAALTKGDVNVINYHTSLKNTADAQDDINLRNTVDPSARVSFYGVNSMTSFLDGSVDVISGEIEGDVSWTENQLILKSLADPYFTIDPVIVNTSANKILAEIRFTAFKTVSAGTELLLFAGIVERKIASVDLGNGQVEYRYVLRKMLPDGSGEIYNVDSELLKGDKLTFNDAFKADPTGSNQFMEVNWVPKNLFEGESQGDIIDLSMVVFVQNKVTKEIVQSSIIAVDGKSVITSFNGQIISDNLKLYPNPTSTEVNVILDEQATETMDWILFDQTGKIFTRGKLPIGHEAFSIDVNDFPSGLYFISVGGEEKRFKHKKLMIIH